MPQPNTLRLTTTEPVRAEDTDEMRPAYELVAREAVAALCGGGFVAGAIGTVAFLFNPCAGWAFTAAAGAAAFVGGFAWAVAIVADDPEEDEVEDDD